MGKGPLDIRTNYFSLENYVTKITDKGKSLDSVKFVKDQGGNNLNGHFDCFDCVDYLKDIVHSYSDLVAQDAKALSGIHKEMSEQDEKLKY